MKAKIKFFFVICMMLCVATTLFAQAEETFDGYYDDAAVVNTTLTKLGKYKISINTAANEYMTLFSVDGERGYIACYNGKYQCWVYRRGFGYQDWVTPAFDMSQVDISKLYKSVDERINLNRTGLDTAKLSPLSSYVPPITDFSPYYDDKAVVNNTLTKLGKYKISINTAANEYMTLFSVDGERGYIACYNGKYQCWVYRRGFGYQDWVTPAFDMNQVDISKLYKSVDERIDLNRTGLDTATLKPLSSVPTKGGKTTTTTTTTTTSSTTTTGKTNTTTTSAGSAPLTGKTSTTTTTETKTPVVRPVIVNTPDESGGWYDDAAEWNTSITSMGPYTISYNIQKGKFALAMISYPGDSAYIACYDLMYQYWHYRRGYNGYQTAFDPYFDMSQWNTAKLFKKVDPSITLDRHVSKGEESLMALSTKIVPYERPDELSDIGIDGKRFEKTSFVKIPEITIIIGSDKDGVFVTGRSVVLTPYIIGKYEVTQELYEAVTGSNPSKHTSDTPYGETQKLRPVEKVELFDIAKFCNKLSALDGLQPVFTISGNTITADLTKNGWRVPTEAEWECAARGANPNAKEWKYKYAGTDSEKDATSYMWIKSNSDDTSHEVGLKKPNSLGLYDMLGNVYEWCLDWYDESINKKTMINPTGAASGTERVQRSTAYGSKIGEVTKRDKGSQDKVYIDLGFRLCRNAE